VEAVRLQHVAFCTRSGQHDARDVGEVGRGLDLAEDLEAVHARQPEVEQDEVRPAGRVAGRAVLQVLERALAVRHVRELEPRAVRLEAASHELGVVGVVFDQEDAEPFPERATHGTYYDRFLLRRHQPQCTARMWPGSMVLG
jgi:hypothetical protein